MDALLANGRLVDLILIMVFVEAAGLAVWRRRTGGGVAIGDLLPNLAAGFFLLLALRCALAQAGATAICASLGAALVAHVLDIARRWRSA